MPWPAPTTMSQDLKVQPQKYADAPRKRAPSPWAYRAGWRQQRHVRQFSRDRCPDAAAGGGADDAAARGRALERGPGLAKPWGRAPSPWAYRGLLGKCVKAPVTQPLLACESRGPDPALAWSRLPPPSSRLRASSHPLTLLARGIRLQTLQSRSTSALHMESVGSPGTNISSPTPAPLLLWTGPQASADHDGSQTLFDWLGLTSFACFSRAPRIR